MILYESILDLGKTIRWIVKGKFNGIKSETYKSEPDKPYDFFIGLGVTSLLIYLVYLIA